MSTAMKKIKKMGASGHDGHARKGGLGGLGNALGGPQMGDMLNKAAATACPWRHGRHGGGKLPDGMPQAAPRLRESS